MNTKINKELLHVASMLANDWITVDEMRTVCASCADKMEKNNIKKVKASAIVENIRMALEKECDQK